MWHKDAPQEAGVYWFCGRANYEEKFLSPVLVAVETAVHPNGVSEISGRILFEGPDYAGEEFSSLHEWTSLDDDGWANGRWWGEKLTPPKQPAAC